MLEVRRAGERFVSAGDGIRSWHSFSAGSHFDPNRMSFGALIGHDEHLLEPGAGFEPHRHRDVEILTWVLEGALRHSDDSGGRRDIQVGQLHYQRAGLGIEHSERNASTREPVRFIQMLLRPSNAPGPPAYRLLDQISNAGPVTELDAATTFRVSELADGTELRLSVDSWLHVHVARGAVELGHVPLAAGDSAELRVDTAGPYVCLLRSIGESELLLFSGGERGHSLE